MVKAITRRAFQQWAGGFMAAAGSAAASTKDFTTHRILRRPYKHVESVAAKPYMLWDCIRMAVSSRGQAIRITVQQDGSPEPALQATVTPRSKEHFMLLGVHNMRAETPVTITIESRQKFEPMYILAIFMYPPFRRQDGMIIYHDPFYKPHEEGPDFGVAENLIHRKVFGPGKDVGYS